MTWLSGSFECWIFTWCNAIFFVSNNQHGFASYINYRNWTVNSCPSNPNTTICLSIFNDTLNQVGVIGKHSGSVFSWVCSKVPLLFCFFFFFGAIVDQPLLVDQLGRLGVYQPLKDDNLPSLNPDAIYYSYWWTKKKNWLERSEIDWNILQQKKKTTQQWRKRNSCIHQIKSTKLRKVFSFEKYPI